MMDEKAKENMKEAKLKLYHLILHTSTKDLTDNEIGIGFLLARDKQMQEIFDKKFNGGKKR